MGNNALFILSKLHKLEQCTDAKASFNVTVSNLLWKCQWRPSAPSAISNEKQAKDEVFLFNCNTENWLQSTPRFKFKDTVLTHSKLEVSLDE